MELKDLKYPSIGAIIFTFLYLAYSVYRGITIDSSLDTFGLYDFVRYNHTYGGELLAFFIVGALVGFVYGKWKMENGLKDLKYPFIVAIIFTFLYLAYSVYRVITNDYYSLDRLIHYYYIDDLIVIFIVGALIGLVYKKWKMKELSYWLKGGMIFLIISIILYVILSFIPYSGGFPGGYEVIMLIPAFPLINLLSLISFEGEATMYVIIFGCYFFYGALIGLAVGKIKSRSH